MLGGTLADVTVGPSPGPDSDPRAAGPPGRARERDSERERALFGNNVHDGDVQGAAR